MLGFLPNTFYQGGRFYDGIFRIMGILIDVSNYSQDSYVKLWLELYVMTNVRRRCLLVRGRESKRERERESLASQP